MTFQLLILGGTSEARALAQEVPARFGARLHVITSLAGRTRAPAPVAGEVRRGGFGGVAGLTRYLRKNGVAAVIDATHPFATVISAHARAATAAAGTPLLAIRRPPWQKQPGDRWIEVDDVAGAVDVLRRLGDRVWLTLGGRDLAPFAALAGKRFLVRAIDPPRQPLAVSNAHIILGRGPFTLADEAGVIAKHRIDVVVTKASGGSATAAKLAAARAAGIPVVMIRRPPSINGSGEVAESLEAALDWIAGRLGIDASLAARL